MSSSPGEVGERVARRRIGIVSCLHGVNKAALYYLMLQLNTVQESFGFEFFDCNSHDPFIAALSSNDRTVEREHIRSLCDDFWARFRSQLTVRADAYETKELPPDRLVVLTKAKFDDNYYSLRRKNVSVIALGNWERSMAPPSILEFVVTLTIREAIAVASPALKGSVHLGTKGCPCDITSSLEDARQKVLSSHLCDFCKELLTEGGAGELIPDIESMLSKSWLGSADVPSSPAGVVSALGHDLFIVKGLRPTVWEHIRAAVHQDGVKQVLTLAQTTVGAVLVAVLLLTLGLKN